MRIAASVSSSIGRVRRRPTNAAPNAAPYGDNALLLDTIGKLAAKGNTVVVVEHDEETIRRAEHVVDLGPGAGRNGSSLFQSLARQTSAGSTPEPDSASQN